MKRDKYIRLKVDDQTKLLEAVASLADLYVASSFTDEIKVSQVLNEKAVYILTFTNQPDFERFKYFVNYLNYPSTGEFSSDVRGYCSIDNGDIEGDEFIGSRAMLYVSENDTEYDNVFSAFDSTVDHYKLGFSSGDEFVKLTSNEPPFSEKRFDLSDLELIQIITPSEAAIENKNKEAKKGIGCLMVLPVICLLPLLALFSCNQEETKLTIVYKEGGSVAEGNHLVMNEQKVGIIEAIQLNADFDIYLEVVLDKDIKLPVDSEFILTNINLFEKGINIIPGNSKQYLSSHDTVVGKLTDADLIPEVGNDIEEMFDTSE